MNRRKVWGNLSMAFVLALVVAVSGCGQNSDGRTHGESSVLQANENSGEKITESETEDAVENEQVPSPGDVFSGTSSTADIVEETLTLPADMPSVFSFSSGAGGWSTTVTFRPDGSFVGVYSDSDLGTTDEDYPHGTAYYCNFSGKLEVTEKLDEYSYGLKLVTLNKEKGEEYIEEGIRYVPSEPYGMEKGKNYILYLPDTPLEGLSEEFLLWWPGRYDMDNQDQTTLNCFGMYNKETEYGFFSEAK